MAARDRGTDGSRNTAAVAASLQSQPLVCAREGDTPTPPQTAAGDTTKDSPAMTATPTPTRAAIYARVARDSDGNTLAADSQVTVCREHAEHLGWTVSGEYIDNGTSANSPRPELARLLADVRAGTVDGLVVLHLDRLARRLNHLAPVLDAVESVAHPVPVAVVQRREVIDLNTDEGRLLAGLVMGSAPGQPPRR